MTFNTHQDIGTINSIINGTPKDVYLPILNQYSILAVANFFHIITYGYVIWASKFGTAKIECRFEKVK